MKLRFIIVLSCFIAQISAQQIIVDGDFQDWDNSSPIVNDAGDSQGLDIESVQVSYDDIYLFLKVEFNQEILLQQNNNILLGVDFDNNTNSGFDLGAIGAELVFNCGQRNGILSAGQAILQIQHEDIGLISSPTVSSNEFEIAIKRRFSVSGQSFEMGNIVSVHISGELEQGDQLPDFGRFEIPLSDSRPQQNQDYTLAEAALADFRFMSFNVLRDNIFEFGVRSAFASLMKAVNADVYCFQEVYDHDDDELLDLLLSLNILDQSQSWYSVKHDPDLITISRYPIVYEQNVGNNSASVLDVDGTELLIVNMHLPCCENDFGREIEIDQVLRFVRRSKDGQLQYQLQDNTPYIFCGDLNLVGDASQLESLISGNINDNGFFGPDVTLDWDDDHMTDLKAPTTGYPAVFTWYS
ncbi:MAG: endonuclease/exonuclease/phosphatase family protein, partial [Bacteroidia bacterium]|nr:endonuclease/exonuclease/phosphatase family protein [Bacteroidia bacterium]